MKAQIIRNANGFGLEKDGEVLASVLTDHQVTFTKPSIAHFGNYDVNFHLEHIVGKNFATAPINICIPNPEWCSRSMSNTLQMATCVFAKTRDSERIFTELGHCPVRYTGWTSPDPYLPEVKREKKMVHIAGMSPLKSTHAVIEAMRHLPSIPIEVYYRRGAVGAPSNVKHIKQGVKAEDMRNIINASSIHLLPSQMEGFGHMLNEAMAVGATVITTDHPPMNTFGAQYHVNITGTHKHNLADIAHLDPTDLRNKIQEAWGGNNSFDEHARNGYLVRDKLFRSRFAEELELTLQKQAA